MGTLLGFPNNVRSSAFFWLKSASFPPPLVRCGSGGTDVCQNSCNSDSVIAWISAEPPKEGAKEEPPGAAVVDGEPLGAAPAAGARADEAAPDFVDAFDLGREDIVGEGTQRMGQKSSPLGKQCLFTQLVGCIFFVRNYFLIVDGSQVQRKMIPCPQFDTFDDFWVGG